MALIMTPSELLQMGFIRKGSWFRIPVDPKRSYTISKRKSGSKKNQKFRNGSRTYVYGRYTGEHKEGMIKLVQETTDFKVKLQGLKGVTYGGEELNKLCEYLFSMKRYGILSHCITAEELRALPEELVYNKVNYWTGTSYTHEIEAVPQKYYGMVFVSARGEDRFCLYFDQAENYNGHNGIGDIPLRPVTLLPSNSPIIMIFTDEEHDGETKETAFEVFLASELDIICFED